jgi:hypothetical protein
MTKNNHKVTELSKQKPRDEEEKFFAKFSETQLNAILLLILSATFMIQGITSYLETLHHAELIRSWFIITIVSLIFLVASVVSITLGGVIAPLKFKRSLEKISFGNFILGVLFFMTSLFFLFFIFLVAA